MCVNFPIKLLFYPLFLSEHCYVHMEVNMIIILEIMRVAFLFFSYSVTLSCDMTKFGCGCYDIAI